MSQNRKHIDSNYYFHISVIIRRFIRRLILSWLTAVTIEFCLLPHDLKELNKLEGLAQMSFIRVLIFIGVIFALLTILSFFIKTDMLERCVMVGVFAFLAILTLHRSATWVFFGVCVFILVIVTAYSIWGWDNSDEIVMENKKEEKQKDKKKDKLCKLYKWITIVLCVLFFVFVSAWTVGRVYSFCCPTYDFGIFAQMFHNMKNTGLPVTTLERSGRLSHFAVHVSPIYYILLPIYWLISIPAVLQVLQAAVITSAVIPLWKLGKHYGLSGLQRMFICALLLLYPAYSGGTSYDIHENCFLTPLLLWLFYGIDRKNTMIAAIAAVLTLMVKEDAAIYVAIIAIWYIFSTLLRYKKKDMRSLIGGVGLLILSVGWFAVAVRYLTVNGEGIMSCRYDNFKYDGASPIVNVIKAMIINPMKVVYECADKEKLYFIGMTLIPLLGIPLLTRKYERYILLIPYLLINLIPDYQYQHDIFFQYTFGSVAIFFYLMVVNLADIKADRRINLSLFTALVVSAVVFGRTIVPKAIRYPVQAIQNYDYYQNIRDVLDTIPDDASVTATAFYTAYLSGREILYDIYYCSRQQLLETDYVVIDVTSNNNFKKYATAGMDNGYEKLTELLMENGYREYMALDNGLVIWNR